MDNCILFPLHRRESPSLFKPCTSHSLLLRPPFAQSFRLSVYILTRLSVCPHTPPRHPTVKRPFLCLSDSFSLFSSRRALLHIFYLARSDKKEIVSLRKLSHKSRRDGERKEVHDLTRGNSSLFTECHNIVMTCQNNDIRVAKAARRYRKRR